MKSPSLFRRTNWSCSYISSSTLRRNFFISFVYFFKKGNVPIPSGNANGSESQARYKIRDNIQILNKPFSSPVASPSQLFSRTMWSLSDCFLQADYWNSFRWSFGSSTVLLVLHLLLFSYFLVFIPCLLVLSEPRPGVLPQYAFLFLWGQGCHQKSLSVGTQHFNWLAKHSFFSRLKQWKQVNEQRRFKRKSHRSVTDWSPILRAPKVIKCKKWSKWEDLSVLYSCLLFSFVIIPFKELYTFQSLGALLLYTIEYYNSIFTIFTVTF